MALMGGKKLNTNAVPNLFFNKDDTLHSVLPPKKQLTEKNINILNTSTETFPDDLSPQPDSHTIINSISVFPQTPCSSIDNQIISENTEEITSTIQNQNVSQPTLPEEKTPTKQRRVFLTTPKTRKLNRLKAANFNLRKNLKIKKLDMSTEELGIILKKKLDNFQHSHESDQKC